MKKLVFLLLLAALPLSAQIMNSGGNIPAAGADGACQVSSGGVWVRGACSGSSSSTPGGSDTQLQFNDATVLAGATTITYNKTTGQFTVSQKADTNETLYGKRFTDTTPTGNFLHFQNAAANADLFKVTVGGAVTAVSFSGSGAGLTSIPQSGLAAGNYTIGAYYIDQAEIATPANPSAGVCRQYVDSTTHKVTFLNSAGSSCIASGGGGGITNSAASGVIPKTIDVSGNLGTSLLSDNGTTLSYTGTGGASVDHITTTGTASAMTTTAVADGTTANSFWLSSTTANRWKTYVGGLQVFAYQSDGINVFAAGAIANGSTATTQSDNDNSTKLATTAYVDGHAVAAAKIPAVSVVVDTATPITVSTTLNAEMHFNEHATAATAMVYNLPTAAAGKQFCFANAYNGSAANTGTVKLVPSATGQYIIFTDGTLTTNTTGYVISGGAAGDAGCVVGVDSTHWMLYVQRGTWTKA